MRIIATLGAGLLAMAGFAAIPAEAQRYGWNDRGHGWHGDRGWRGDRWNRGRGWRGDRWGRGRAPRFRTVCNVRPSYWGPVRQCFQVRR